MTLSAHQPQYLPWLGYFHKIYSSEIFVFLDNVQYKKREYQNRNRIRTRDNSIWLTVPVLTNDNSYPNISDVRIDNSQDWRNSHWKSLYLNYSRALFFKKYSDFFEDLYKREWDKLIDLNICIIRHINTILGITTSMYLSSQLNIKAKGTERIIDICKSLQADTYLSGMGGKDYLEEDMFKADSIKLVYQDFVHPIYTQLNMKDEKDFIPNLSIVDLIFNHGPKSLDILTGNRKIPSPYLGEG